MESGRDVLETRGFDGSTWLVVSSRGLVRDNERETGSDVRCIWLWTIDPRLQTGSFGP